MIAFREILGDIPAYISPSGLTTTTILALSDF